MTEERYLFNRRLKLVSFTLMILGLLGLSFGFITAPKNIQEAKEIIKLFNSSSEAVIAYKGKMIDMQIVLSMEKRLRLVGIELKNID